MGGTTELCIIADDHPLFRLALKQVVEEVLPAATLVEASTADVLAHTGSPAPSLLLYSLPSPDRAPWSRLAALADLYPEAALVVVCDTTTPELIEGALRLGASGLLPKTLAAAEMVDALRTVMAGCVWLPPVQQGRRCPSSGQGEWLSRLTVRERDVLALLCQGKLNKQIAYELGVTETTIKAHVSGVLEKVGVRTRTQAILAYSKLPEGVLCAKTAAARIHRVAQADLRPSTADPR